MTRELFSCPHCGAKFGDEIWRDNHAATCERFSAIREAATQKQREQTQRYRGARQKPRVVEYQFLRPAPEWTKPLEAMLHEFDRTYAARARA